MKTVLKLFVMAGLSLPALIQAQSFNAYFGNIHSQTSYSDGNKDSSTSGITTPLQAFTYANASQQIDFYGISDHNHLNAGMTSPAHFHMGLADANAANNDGSFVALYGQEWGVISGGGHAIVYGYDSLMGWDSGDYDVFVAQNNYAGLWNKVNAKPGAFAYLAHPQATDYSNFFSAYTASADNAVVGMAARSGPAFSTNNTYSNPSTSDFTARYQDALARGYHLGIGLDHDTHNSVFGRQTAGRLVVLAPGLTRYNILDGIKKMRMYSSDDWNTRVDFNIGNQPMGSIYAHANTPTINVTVTDPDGESTSSIKIYYGVPGSGSLATILTSNTSSNSLVYNHVIANATTYYYYAEITQTDGDVIWTSPIWYTRNNTITANAPVTSFTFSGTSFCVGQAISLSDLSTNAPTGWQWTLIGASVTTSTLQNPVLTYTASGIYSITLVSTNTVGTGLPYTKTISIGGTAPVITVSGGSSVCAGSSVAITASGASNYTWSTGANTSGIIVTPTATSVFTVTGSNGGCTASVTKSVSVSTSPTVNVSGLNPVCGGSSSTLTASGAASYSWNTGATVASIIVSPTVNTTYTVTGTSANGCKNKAVTTLSVGTSPTITIAGQTTLCAGYTTTLTSSGANSYTWNTGSNATGIVVTPTVNTTYTVTGANASGCQSSKTVTVTVNALPVITIAGSNTTCTGNPLTLTGSGAASYTWSTGANTSTLSVSPTANTTYTLTGTNANGCNNSTIKTITVTTATVIATGGTICPGNSFTINPSGAATYTYSGGSQIVNPPTTTSYTVYGTTSQGCNAQPAQLTVSVAPALTINITGAASICYGNSATLIANGATSYTWNTGSGATSIIISPTANTTYSVIGANTAGCKGSSAVTVTVNALPVLTIAGSNTTCSGNPLTLTGSGAASYTWNTGANTQTLNVSPTANTTYTLTGTNANGCKNAATKTVTVSTPLIAANGGAVCPGNSFTINPSGAATYTYSGGSQIVSPSSTTSYTVYGTTSQGCLAQAAVLTVTVAPTLNVSISGTNTVCAGNSIVLTANGAASYTWNTGATSNAITVAPSASTTYSVFGSGGSGCSGTSLKTIIVMTLPVVTAVSSNSTICAGQAATLTANGANTYFWSNSATSAAISVSPSVTTTYTVTGTNANGCLANTNITQSVSICTGFDTGANENIMVELFPNPTKGNFTVLAHQSAVIALYNLTGQLVLEKKINAGYSSFSIETESPGLYFIRISTPAGTTTKRLIKE